MAKDNSKVVRIKTKSNGVIALLEQAIDIVNEEKIDNLMIAMKIKNETGYVLTGYSTLNLAEKIELISHLHVDVMKGFIEENYITPNN